MKEIKVVIKKILTKENGKVMGVSYNVDEKIYTHEELCKMLYLKGLEAFFENANDYSYYADDKGNPSYIIWSFRTFII